jgi:hypothetical protein
MKPLKPANLYEAVVYAKDMEKGMLATAQSHNIDPNQWPAVPRASSAL